MELSQNSKQGEHLLIKKLILFFLMHRFVCTGVVIHEWKWPWSPEEGREVPRAGVTDSSKPPDMCAGN